ncbi:merozoite surface protein 3b [Candidatus Saccharibacteria bacterium]|nr:merozoite surface protein 3b [Candidatus Saccharibacteria bacterium]
MISTVVNSYLEKAVSGLAKLGINIPQAEAPVVALIEKIAKYDNAKALAVAQTLQKSSAFNEVVRGEIKGMEISTRYANIAESFNSIRDDAATMATWMDDGKLDLAEKIQNMWIKIRRGSIPDRFEKIKSEYLAVSKSAQDQLSRESIILKSYMDFRMALKTAEVLAQEMLVTATAELDRVKGALDASAGELESIRAEGSVADVAAAELRRDEALRLLQDETKSHQIVKDIADDLKTGYNTAELVFARLNQTHDVKERLYQRSVTFFATNEVVFTGLAASFTSMAGLGEATNTMEAMKAGINRGLEDLATTGGAQLEAGLRSGYGSTLKSSSVKVLADAIVEFQSSSIELIKVLQQESTETAAEIETITEDSKKKFAALLSRV